MHNTVDYAYPDPHDSIENISNLEYADDQLPVRTEKPIRYENRYGARIDPDMIDVIFDHSSEDKLDDDKYKEDDSSSESSSKDNIDQEQDSKKFSKPNHSTDNTYDAQDSIENTIDFAFDDQEQDSRYNNRYGGRAKLYDDIMNFDYDSSSGSSSAYINEDRQLNFLASSNVPQHKQISSKNDHFFDTNDMLPARGAEAYFNEYKNLVDQNVQSVAFEHDDSKEQSLNRFTMDQWADALNEKTTIGFLTGGLFKTLLAAGGMIISGAAVYLVKKRLLAAKNRRQAYIDSKQVESGEETETTETLM